jgi:hypothetical protein
LTSYGKGAVIYSGSCQSLYLVVSGRVKVSGTAGDAWNVIIKIVQPEGLFGESCLVGQEARECAMALNNVVHVMAWPRDEIEQLVEKEPRLGLALIEDLVDVGVANPGPPPDDGYLQCSRETDGLSVTARQGSRKGNARRCDANAAADSSNDCRVRGHLS